VVKAAEARRDFAVLVARERRALRVHLGADVTAGLNVRRAAAARAVEESDMTDSPSTRGTSKDVRLVVADVDGTLLTPGKVLTPRARAAVHAVIEAGIAIPTEHIATIGDMPNDVLMFERSGTSIAMGNASPDVHMPPLS